MTTNTDTLYVVQTGEAFGIRQGNPGEDAPEAYVSRSALKAIVRAALNAEGAPIVVAPEVAVAAGRANMELMAAATKASMVAGLISMASSFTDQAAGVLGAEFDIDAAIADVNRVEDDENEDEPAEF